VSGSTFLTPGQSAVLLADRTLAIPSAASGATRKTSGDGVGSSGATPGPDPAFLPQTSPIKGSPLIAPTVPTPGSERVSSIVADAIPGGEPPSSEALAAVLARARPFFERGLERPLAPGEWQRVLDTPTGAALGTAALSGRRALLLLEGGLGARSYFLAPIAQMLASHGYVVAALATAGASETDRLGAVRGLPRRSPSARPCAFSLTRRAAPL
jgi:hypothetical protein